MTGMDTIQQTNIKDYLAVLGRRRAAIFGTMAGLFLLSVVVAFLWPPAYRSTGTILIEEQEIPQDIVRTTITSFADQRIQKIKQQVMTRSTLLRIVDQYHLYESLRRRKPTEVVLEEFIGDINIDVISADVVDKRTGRPTKATIAFTLSYDGDTPAVAQKVANELTNLFLAENLKSRERQAQEATAFLQKEAQDLADHIEVIAKKIADFKHQADGALPEHFDLNMQLMNQADRELMDLNQRLTELEDRRIHLEGQLSIIKPNTPIVTTTGERILDSDERLKALRAQFASSAALFSEEHPDIIKMKQEIEALEKAGGQVSGIDELHKRLADEHANIESLLKRYGDDHPDVARSRNIIGSLEKQIDELAQRPVSEPSVKPENPAYLQALTQLNATTNEIDALKQTRSLLKRKIDTYSDKLERTSELEPAYLELVRNRDNSTQKYHEIRFRLLEAKVSQELEEQRMGERFSLIDPPDLPEQPESPNRSAILLLGGLIAFIGGLGSGAVAESMDQSIQSSGGLQAITKVPALGVIPYLPNTEDLHRMEGQRKTVRWAGVGGLVFLILLGHFLWLPLDVVWFAVLRKLGVG